MKFKMRGKKYSLEGILILLPAVILYGLVIVFPVCNTLYTSFFEWNGIAQEPYVFVGLENYITFLMITRRQRHLKMYLCWQA